jgi:hypothetical protein
MAGRYFGGGMVYPSARALRARVISRSQLGQRLSRESRRTPNIFEIGNVCDVAAVFFAVKDVDVIILHGSSPNFQIIPLDEMKKLLNLIWLGFAVHLLQIDHLSNLRMNKDVMTTAHTRRAEAEGFD